MGRAHARGRGAAVGRAPRTADPALRRPPHRGAGARHRRARCRCACRSRSPPTAKSASDPSRSAISPASSSGSTRRRGSPTSACCSRPPNAGSAKSSIAAPSALIEAPDDGLRAGRPKTAADSRSPGRVTCSPDWRPAARLLEPALRTARALDRLSAQSRAALRARLEQWLDAQVTRHLEAAPEAGGDGNGPGKLAGRSRPRRDAGRCRRRYPTQGHARRHRPPRTDRPAGASQACASVSARWTSSCRLLLKPAAQHWRAALLAVRGRPAHAHAARARRSNASGARPTRAARRSLIAGSADSGCASTSPTASPATPARFAPRAATIRSIPRSRLPSASARKRSRD